ncbi:MAG: hypothetical protein M0C28_48360 [Candidatus Moduliflexus flocculans]|nr:hypothetical protein [Candidatus Moduliflexus flocculans]
MGPAHIESPSAPARSSGGCSRKSRPSPTWPSRPGPATDDELGLYPRARLHRPRPARRPATSLPWTATPWPAPRPGRRPCSPPADPRGRRPRHGRRPSGTPWPSSARPATTPRLRGPWASAFFNNAAIAAEHLVRTARPRPRPRRRLGPPPRQRHGAGVLRTARRHVLLDAPGPLFPGTGAVRFFGRGEGFGYNLNVPLLAGKGDAEYLRVFEGILAPVAAEFRPEFIVASAGFDIAAGDPLGGMAVTSAGFGRLAASLAAMAERTAGGRLALVLEGGYDLAAMREGVAEVLRALDRSGRAGPGTARGKPFGDQSQPHGRARGAPANLPQEMEHPRLGSIEASPFLATRRLASPI